MDCSAFIRPENCGDSNAWENDLLCQLPAYRGCNLPAYEAMTEDIQDDAQVNATPLGRPLGVGDVPRSDLVGCDGQQLWLGIASRHRIQGIWSLTTFDRYEAVAGQDDSVDVEA
jgi:hypothetical protein